MAELLFWLAYIIFCYRSRPFVFKVAANIFFSQVVAILFLVADILFLLQVAAILRNSRELDPSPSGYNPFIYGNDVDSVDIATRVAMVRQDI